MPLTTGIGTTISVVKWHLMQSGPSAGKGMLPSPPEGHLSFLEAAHILCGAQTEGNRVSRATSGFMEETGNRARDTISFSLSLAEAAHRYPLPLEGSDSPLEERGAELSSLSEDWGVHPR